MARKHQKIERKVTSSGIKATILDNVVIKEYSRTSVIFMTFADHKIAKKEFNKHRKGYREL